MRNDDMRESERNRLVGIHIPLHRGARVDGHSCKSMGIR